MIREYAKKIHQIIIMFKKSKPDPNIGNAIKMKN